MAAWYWYLLIPVISGAVGYIIGTLRGCTNDCDHYSEYTCKNWTRVRQQGYLIVFTLGGFIFMMQLLFG
jgi:hypothetical protein